MAPSPKALAHAIGIVPLLAACVDLVEPVHWRSPAADDSAVPPAARAAYRVDAERLAVRYLLTTAGAVSRIDVPSSLVDDFYRRLVLVHTAHDLPARDSVVDVYAIHTFRDPETRELLVVVDKATPWLAEWYAGRALTGEPGIDTVVARFGLTVTRCQVMSVFDGDTMCLLVSGRALVMWSLGRLVATVRGVRFAQPNGGVGDGNDVLATRKPDAWELDYSLGWGDCPSGCTGRHDWRFLVADDGRVAFTGSTGPPPPDARP